MAAVAFGLLVLGVLLVFAGMTGGSLVKATSDVLSGQATAAPVPAK